MDGAAVGLVVVMVVAGRIIVRFVIKLVGAMFRLEWLSGVVAAIRVENDDEV